MYIAIKNCLLFYLILNWTMNLDETKTGKKDKIKSINYLANEQNFECKRTL